MAVFQWGFGITVADRLHRMAAGRYKQRIDVPQDRRTTTQVIRCLELNIDTYLMAGRSTGEYGSECDPLPQCMPARTITALRENVAPVKTVAMSPWCRLWNGCSPAVFRAPDGRKRKCTDRHSVNFPVIHPLSSLGIDVDQIIDSPSHSTSATDTVCLIGSNAVERFGQAVDRRLIPTAAPMPHRRRT